MPDWTTRLNANFEDTCKSQDETASDANEEHRSNVQEERNPGIADENGGADILERKEWCHALREGDEETRNNSTDGCVVVERHERIHLEIVQQDLDHHQAGGLELDAVSYYRG